MEVVWATKCWPNRVFAFLLSISEVNCRLAETQFTSQCTDSMLSYRKKLAYELIENAYIKREEIQEQLSRSPRRSRWLLEETGHGFVSVPPNKTFKDGRLVSSKSRYPQHKCSRCPREIRTYCRCTPGVYLCSSCFSEHVLVDADRLKCTSRFTIFNPNF